MTGVMASTPERLNRLLASDADRGDLLRELSALAQDQEFRYLAHIWAPALIERDAALFQSFLLRQLDGVLHRKLIKDLLPHIEETGQDRLFQALYRLVTEESEWERELRELATSDRSDDEVVAALERRDMSTHWFSMSQDAALALYRRNPDRFAGYLQKHICGGWGGPRHKFAKLREATAERQDELHWHLFRQFADGKEWRRELQALVARDVGAGQVAEELAKRHPAALWDVDASPVVPFIAKYGQAVVPYVRENLRWLSQHGGSHLLDAVERLGDEQLYWQVFFTAADSARWNAELRKLLQRAMTDEELLAGLQLRTPPAERRGLRLDAEVAIELARRDTRLFRPFVEQFLDEGGVNEGLFAVGVQADDEEFLDFVSFAYLRRMESLAWRAFPSGPRARKPDEAARQEIETGSAMLIERFERLHAESPDVYVRHAANILGRYRAFSIWTPRQSREQVPAFGYLAEEHREAWLASPEAVRDLLECTNIHIQIIGLELLREGGEAAAKCVVHSLPILRTFLLGRAYRGTKKLALRALEQAAALGGEFAAAVLPVLKQASHLRGKRAIDERIIASYVRTSRALREAGVTVRQ